MRSKADLKLERQRDVQALKRQKILDAAALLFRQNGLEGTTMRAIATAAGYSTGAPYAHFQSKEDIYAELLNSSLTNLTRATKDKVTPALPAFEQIHAVFRAYFEYYQNHTEELQLGLYLCSAGEIKKRGFSDETNQPLTSKLIALLGFLANNLHKNSSSSAIEAQRETLDAITYFTGCLILSSTGRLASFGSDPEEMVDRYIDQMLERVGF